MAYSVFIVPRFITSKEVYLELSQTTTTIHAQLLRFFVVCQKLTNILKHDFEK